MPTNNKSISVTYSDEMLRILVEEYITMQKKEFYFKGVCSYILYRAMEEDRTKGDGLYEGNELTQEDSDRVRQILDRIVMEKRLKFTSDNTRFVKLDN